MKGWSKVYSNSNELSVNMLAGMLKEHNIEVNILNKRDSAYGLFGETELYVREEHFLKATNLIKVKIIEKSLD